MFHWGKPNSISCLVLVGSSPSPTPFTPPLLFVFYSLVYSPRHSSLFSSPLSVFVSSQSFLPLSLRMTPTSGSLPTRCTLQLDQRPWCKHTHTAHSLSTWGFMCRPMRSQRLRTDRYCVYLCVSVGRHLERVLECDFDISLGNLSHSLRCVPLQ